MWHEKIFGAVERMGDLTNNFSRHEFACECGCGFDDISLELVEKLQELRDYFDARVDVTSGCRCPVHNTRVGGAKHSRHLAGDAADIVVDNVHPDLVAELADQLGFKGVGWYNTFTHVDTRPGRRARWDNRTEDGT